MQQALSGIRILDFTQMMLGPLCTQTLSDFGAEVIKVERPDKGEWMRGMPMVGAFVGDESSAFHAFNRNKKSITVDMKSPEGVKALLDMAKQCDVVTENFRSGVMDRLGLGYADFKAVNPKIIYASGSGWGANSVYAQQNWPGQDLLIQGMSGVMMNTGRGDGAPTACGTPVADFAAAQSLAIGILIALHARNTYGIGQKVEADLYSSLLNMMAQENFAVMNQDLQLQRSDTGVASCWNDSPYGAFETADGWVVIALCPLPILADIFDDAGLLDMDAWHQRDAVNRRIESHTKTYTSADLLQVLRQRDVWTAPVRTTREAIDDALQNEPHRLAVMQHKKAGTVTAIANPVTLSETPAQYKAAAPLLGEHTEHIIADILGQQALQKLKQAGAI